MADVVRLLLCDDSPDLRYLTRLRLEEDPGIQVVSECSTAEQLVAQVATQRPDVALVDHVISGRRLRDLMPKLRASSPRTVFLLYSGLPPDWLADQAERLEVDGTLHKGLEMSEVRRAVLRAGGAPS